MFAANERDEKVYVAAAVLITDAVLADRGRFVPEEGLGESIAFQKCRDRLALLLHPHGGGDVGVFRHEGLEAGSACHGCSPNSR
jgi:hypothetical protein